MKDKSGMISFDVKQNYPKAKDIYELSSKRNNPVAQLYLGDLYINGLEVEKD